MRRTKVELDVDQGKVLDWLVGRSEFGMYLHTGGRRANIHARACGLSREHYCDAVRRLYKHHNINDGRRVARRDDTGAEFTFAFRMVRRGCYGVLKKRATQEGAPTPAPPEAPKNTELLAMFKHAEKVLGSKLVMMDTRLGHLECAINIPLLNKLVELYVISKLTSKED